jgi:16S rRNA (cytosine1402-N4)-methyltransferase
MLEALRPQDSGVYLDATFGGGGYSRAILDSAHCTVIALDRDPEAIQRAERLTLKYPDRFHVYQGTFSDLPSLFALHHLPKLDGIVFDFGVSSFQIDQAERGFSFRFEGPLDMRMSQEGITAADVVNTYSEKDLADIIYRFGEEHKSRSIARAIVAARKEKHLQTTEELATLIKATIGGRPDAQHPATLTFQALRIFINDELQEIESGLLFSESCLKAGGRLVTVTFHSLEDHVIKSFLRARSLRTRKPSRLLPHETPPPPPSFREMYPKGITPSDAEIQANPRSRSARLRAAERISTPNENTDSMEEDFGGDFCSNSDAGSPPTKGGIGAKRAPKDLPEIGGFSRSGYVGGGGEDHA